MNKPEPVGRNDHPDEPTLFWSDAELKFIAKRDSKWQAWAKQEQQSREALWAPYPTLPLSSRLIWFGAGMIFAASFIGGFKLALL